MTPQQLKNAILQQAIQGKLVEQRAEEGTGERRRSAGGDIFLSNVRCSRKCHW